MVRAFTQNPSLVYEPEKNGKFALFDGNINGTFIELVIIFFHFIKYYIKRTKLCIFELGLLVYIHYLYDFMLKDSKWVKLLKKGKPWQSYSM